MARGEQGLIKSIADRFGIDARVLGDAIEEEKRESGRNKSPRGIPREGDLSVSEIEDLADQIANENKRSGKFFGFF